MWWMLVGCVGMEVAEPEAPRIPPMRGVMTGTLTSGMAQVVDHIAGGELSADDATAAFRDELGEVDMVGLSIALRSDGADQPRVAPAVRADHDYNDGVSTTYPDEVLVALTEAFVDDGLDVYWTLAIEPGAGAPQDRDLMGHPWAEVAADATDRGYDAADWIWDDPAAVEAFWADYTDAAVRYGRLAEDSGVALFGLGTETEGLFRADAEGPAALVSAMRAPETDGGAGYTGALTYDMHVDAILDPDRREDSLRMWRQLDLDVLGVSVWLSLGSGSVGCGEEDGLDEDALVADWGEVLDTLGAFGDAAALPVAALEFGVAADPSAGVTGARCASQARVDAGEATQAEVLRALGRARAGREDTLAGLFPWENWWVDTRTWSAFRGAYRGVGVRPFEVDGVRHDAAGEALAQTYAAW